MSGKKFIRPSEVTATTGTGESVNLRVDKLLDTIKSRLTVSGSYIRKEQIIGMEGFEQVYRFTIRTRFKVTDNITRKAEAIMREYGWNSLKIVRLDREEYYDVRLSHIVMDKSKTNGLTINQILKNLDNRNACGGNK